MQKMLMEEVFFLNCCNLGSVGCVRSCRDPSINRRAHTRSRFVWWSAHVGTDASSAFHGNSATVNPKLILHGIWRVYMGFHRNVEG